MSRLPYNDEANWRHALLDFLQDGHNPDGSVRNQAPVVNVRDYGAQGNAAQPQEEVDAAIQSAIEVGAHLYFPGGTYTFSEWTFDRPGQRVTFAPDAVLVPANTQSLLTFCGDYQVVDSLNVSVPRAIPDLEGKVNDDFKWPDGLLHFRGKNQTVRNLQIEAVAFITRLVKISQSFNSQFEQIRILGVNTVQGVFIDRTIKPVFVGGEIKGNNSYSKLRNSVGLYLGCDQSGTPAEYSGSGVFAFRAFGLTVHHWETGVRISAQTQDDPTFMGCDIENNTMYGFSFRPISDVAGLPKGGALKNLNIIGCHFENTFQCIHVDASGVVEGAFISGCVFGLHIAAATAGQIPADQILPQRVINAQGVLRGVVMTGCLSFGHALRPDAHIWQVDASVLDCVDLFNYWANMPGGNIATGRSSDSVVRLHASVDSSNGRSLDVKAWLRHHGKGLGFYGAPPVKRPTGYTTLDPATATAADMAKAFNKLVDDLAALGLVEKK